MSTLAGTDGARIVVLVNDVDIENRLAHCQDKTKATIKVTFRDSAGGAFRVPAAGDRWTAIRSGPLWRFEAKLDNPDEHVDFVERMEPGDTRIDADGDIHILGDGIIFNNQPIGATTYSCFTTNGVTRSFTLPTTPVHQHTVQAFINGLLIDPRSFTLGGAVSTYGHGGYGAGTYGVGAGDDPKVVTFLTAPATGTLVIYYQRSGYVYEDASIVRGQMVISVGLAPSDLLAPSDFLVPTG